MFARLVMLLTILAITVVTTVTPAHAARMSMGFGVDHATHVADIVHSPDTVERDCDGKQHCGSADAAMCEVVCAGLSAFLTASGTKSGHAHGPARHSFPSDAIHVGRVPGLTEHPPKLRLL